MEEKNKNHSENRLLSRFLRYVAIETTSNDDSTTQPSTQCQFDLLNVLCEELIEMGLVPNLDDYGYLTVTLPSNIERNVPTIAFIAHVDTSPDASGKDVKPQIVENYDGGDIVLNKLKNIVLSPNDYPELGQYRGQTIITSDGTTLLGADDKAGVAEIMTLLHHLTSHPEVKHGTVKAAFTPDEEIGRGVERFDVKRFASDYAYTIDGGAIGEIEYENFNAASADITIKGVNIHPGEAKGKMINSMLIAMELNAMLPQDEQPALTEGYEGFYHLTSINGSVEETTMHYIIRDHDDEKFKQKKDLILKSCEFLNAKYGKVVEAVVKDQYHNMKVMVEPHYFIVEKAIKAMEMAGVKPLVKPIRGGTDGANLSFMGLPCPNIFAGGHNFHGRFEYVPLQSMEKAVEVMMNIVALFAAEN